MTVNNKELRSLREKIKAIKEEDGIREVLKTDGLLPLLHSVAGMNSEQQILYAMAITESIQELEGSEPRESDAQASQGAGALALPGWFKGLIDKTEEILDLIKKLRP